MELRRLAILSSVFVCFSTTAPAFAATIVVDNDFADCPQADFNTIQAAVAAAQAGDKILVCPGIYEETVLVNKSDLRIEAQAAPAHLADSEVRSLGDVVLQGTPALEFGFRLLNTTGVLIQGFTVQGYRQANIRIEGSADPLVGISSGNTLRKNVTTAAVIDGIELINSDANLVEHNISFANSGPSSDGIFVTGPRVGAQFQIGSKDNVIRHNETFGNGQHGINLFRTRSGNVVFGNSSHDNRGRGIQIAQSNEENVIENNYVFENGSLILPPPVPPIMGGGIGIFVVNSTLVTVKSNRSERNRANGIALNTAGNNVVTNNRSDSNRTAGIALNGASANLVEQNEVFENTEDGIRLVNNSDSNTVQLNHARRNRRDGIRVDATSGGLTPAEQNTIERNVIRESGELDARDDSVGPGTGGTGNVWINNKCVTENRPGLCEHPGH
jgi:parallel beta-helix repeat protein